MAASKNKNANAARPGGKAWKKHPGVSASAATGRTIGGYSPATIARRAIKRMPKQAA